MEFIVHRPKIDPLYPPEKQKIRMLAKPYMEAVKEELEKLKHVRAIREVFFPDWLANMIVVKKKNDKWRVYVNFIDLNRACPKDLFPVPKID